MSNLLFLSAKTGSMWQKQAIDRARQGVKRSRRTATAPPTPLFIVELIDEDPENPGRYSWQKVTPVDGILTPTDPLIESGEESYTAREFNSVSGLGGLKVEVKFYGYDSTSEEEEKPPVYLFQYAADGKFKAKITGATLISPNRWKYPFVEQIADTNGMWKDKPGGRTGEAYNDAETNNTETGIAGSGDDMSVLPTLVPIGPAVPWVWPIINCEGVLQYHFELATNRDHC